MNLRFLLSKSSRPFIWVGLIWAVIGSGLSGSGYHYFLLFWFLCLVNLYCLFQVFARLLQPEVPAASTGIWGSLKLLSIGIIGLALYKVSTHADFTMLSAMIGISTTVVVPIFGGIWWSRQFTVNKGEGHLAT